MQFLKPFRKLLYSSDLRRGRLLTSTHRYNTIRFLVYQTVVCDLVTLTIGPLVSIISETHHGLTRTICPTLPFVSFMRNHLFLPSTLRCQRKKVPVPTKSNKFYSLISTSPNRFETKENNACSLQPPKFKKSKTLHCTLNFKAHSVQNPNHRLHSLNPSKIRHSRQILLTRPALSLLNAYYSFS